MLRLLRPQGIDTPCLAILMLVLAQLFGGAAEAQVDQMMPAVGDTKAGTPFTDRCPQGQALVGLQLRAGDLVDQVQPVCALSSSPTQVSAAQPQAAYGGGGGSPVRLSCPPDHPIVIGASLDAEGVDAPVVKGILLFCGLAITNPQPRPSTPGDAFLSPTQTEFVLPGMTPPPPPVAQTFADQGFPECAAGLVGVGVFGRAGDYVNQLGLICGNAALSSLRIPPAEKNSAMTPARAKEAAAELAAEQAATAAALAKASPGGPPPPVGDQFLPFVGNPDGGRAFTARCAQGLELIGVELRAGDVIDQARPVCAEAKLPNQMGDAQPYEQAFGGGGGSPANVYCPPDAPAVNGMNIASEGINGAVVHEVDLFCGLANAESAPNPLPSATFATPHQNCSDSFPSVGNCPTGPQGQLRCPSGLIGVGLYGRSGDYLDALGLICGAPNVNGTSAARPAKPPPKIQRGDDLQRAGHMVSRPQ